MRRMLVLLLVLLAVPTAAQVQSRPTDPPLVTAVNESWYQLREPVQFAGELYYPAGATVFFNGNTMVRTGHYNGIPLYVDATVEPYSIVLVPISRGQMQPYERLRRGNLAGTSGSRAPGFPVAPTPRVPEGPPMAAVAPTAPPLPPGAISVYTPADTASAPEAVRSSIQHDRAARRDPDVVGTTGIISRPRGQGSPIVSLRRPESNDGVWIRFGGEKWVSAGAAIPLTPSAFMRVGEYAGFPVYARLPLEEERIYLPTREGLVAPYRLKD
jgi:hypothetical protein